jgi:predicted amino acid-binding ACT domain protein
MEDHFQFLKFAIGTLQSQITNVSQQVKDEKKLRMALETRCSDQKIEIGQLQSLLIESRQNLSMEINENGMNLKTLEIKFMKNGRLGY